MEPNIQNTNESRANIEKKVLFFISGFGLGTIIFFGTYFLMVSGQMTNQKEENQAKDILITSLTQDLEDVTLSQEELNLMLRSEKEKVVALEREMTTFSESSNTDNLINENSLFTTIQDIELRSGPVADSDIKFEVSSGITGEVIEGPRLVGDEVWWNVSFRSSEEGWVNELFLERVPSIVIRIDTDQDGQSDVKIRWEGEYDVDRIVAEPGIDGTYIRYKGEAMPEPYEVVEL